MIALATDRKAEAKNYLERALALNPKFDPVQAGIAQKALSELR